MEIGTNTVVTLRYTMKNKEGEILEDIMNGEPITYLHGTGKISRSLETDIEGMSCGRGKSITLTNENTPGLGGIFHFDVFIDNVRAATPDEIQIGKVIYGCGPGCRC